MSFWRGSAALHERSFDIHLAHVIDDDSDGSSLSIGKKVIH